MPIRFQVDGDFYDHPKSIGMSDAATALWVRAGSYSAAKLLDGFIAEHVLSTLSRLPEEASAELVARGLWRRVKGGYQFHQYAERNLTKADVEADRKYERNRKRQRRAAAKAERQEIDGSVAGNASPSGRKSTSEWHDIDGHASVNPQAVDNAKSGSRKAKAQANTKTVPSGHPPGLPDMSHRDSAQSPDGSVSVSVSVSESVSGSGRGARAAPATASEPPRRCPQHQDDPDPPPCGACADARRGNDAWRLADAKRRRDAPQCPRHRGQPAHNCAACRSEQLANGDP